MIYIYVVNIIPINKVQMSGARWTRLPGLSLRLASTSGLFVPVPGALPCQWGWVDGLSVKPWGHKRCELLETLI